MGNCSFPATFSISGYAWNAGKQVPKSHLSAGRHEAINFVSSGDNFLTINI
jgi:hypothetical protein